MQLKHRISLPPDAWDDLICNLSDVSEARQAKIDAFWKEVSGDIQIIHNRDRILVHSNQLDEDAILALLQPEAHSPAGSHNYSIRVQLSVDSSCFPFLGDQSAEERSYHPASAPSGVTASDGYHSMDDSYYLMSA